MTTVSENLPREDRPSEREALVDDAAGPVERMPVRALSTGGFLLLLVTLAAVLHGVRYFPFIADDSLITLRYADRFVDGLGLTWTDGQAVEGYSNFLWLMLAAGLHVIGIDLILATRILGLVCTALVIFAMARAFPPGARRGWLPFLAAGGAVALSGPVAAWMVGGLEQPLVAALLIWSVVLMLPLLRTDSPQARDALWPSIPLGLLCLTRPDGALSTATTVLAILLAHRFRRGVFPVAVAVAAIPAMCYVGQLAFRLWYYGEWVPNTALVKIHPTSTVLARGWQYVAGGYATMTPLWLFLVVGGIGGLVRRETRGVAILVVAHVLAWTLYLLVIGGDIFPAWRQFVPIYVLAALAFGITIENLRLQARGRLSFAAVLILVSGILQWHLSAQFSSATNTKAVTERWEYRGKAIGETLKSAFGAERPLVAVTASGCIPYWSGLPSLDMLGLNDYYLPRNPPVNFGAGDLAHGLGDGAYVMRQAPDIIVYGSGKRDPDFVSGHEMNAMPEYHRLYAPMRFEGGRNPKYTWYMWMGRESAKIGIEETEASVRIPAYFLNGNPATTARLDSRGVFVAGATRESPAVFNGLRLAPGRWRVEVTSNPPADFEIRDAVTEEVLLSGRRTDVLELPYESDTHVDVRIRPPGERATAIQLVRFVRLDDSEEGDTAAVGSRRSERTL